MRVAVVSHAYVVPAYQRSLIRMAAAPGVSVALVTPSKYWVSAQNRELRLSQFPEGVTTFPLPVWFAGRQGAFIYRPRMLSRSLDEFGAEVILHEQEVYALSALQVARAARRRSRPLVMFVWENVMRKLAWPRRRALKSVLRRTAGILAGSEAAERVHRAWGYDGPIEVIPQMGVDTVNPSPLTGWRVPGTLRVAFVGRLVAEKGVDCLLEAVNLLRQRGVHVDCHIVGTGPELNSLRQMARERGLEREVVFEGALPFEAIRPFLATVDVLVLPSRRTPVWEEQFGRVLVEAMAEGTVAVGSRTGAIPDVLGNQELTFAEGDAVGLAEILEGLGSDERKLASHQKALWRRAGELYTNEVLCRRRLDFLARIQAK